MSCRRSGFAKGPARGEDISGIARKDPHDRACGFEFRRHTRTGTHNLRSPRSLSRIEPYAVEMQGYHIASHRSKQIRRQSPRAESFRLVPLWHVHLQKWCQRPAEITSAGSGSTRSYHIDFLPLRIMCPLFLVCHLPLGAWRLNP